MKRESELTIPTDILHLGDYERHARERLDHAVFEYIAGGCERETTLGNNFKAFDRLGLYTRVLRDFARASTGQSLLGMGLKHPLLLAPVAHQKLVHPEGELATAQACAASDTPLIASTLSSYDLETIAEHCPGDKWFQLYWQPGRSITRDLVVRAEAAGYSAIVLTVDTPVTALRYRPQRAGFTLPAEVTEANFTPYQFPRPRPLSPGESVVFAGFMGDAPNWDDVTWLAGNTKLPLIIKGVTHPADGEQAVRCGAAGIIVSNHGGRSLDGIPATAHLLPQVRGAVGDKVPVLVDGGIRRGSDIFKALALGADAVLIGRPQLYALAVAGALGVAHMIKLLKDELEFTMALAGCPTLQHINENCIY